MRVCEFDTAETYCESNAAAEYLLSSACGDTDGSAHGDVRRLAFAKVPIR
jgi:hypothetical protein